MGVVLAGYYVGVVVGSLVAPALIARVGHIRVFAGLASLNSAVVLVHVVRPEPATWFALRAVSGLCLASLYVVCETWLNGVATNRTRGTLLALYMAVVSGSLLAGQLLFTLADPAGFAAFVLASVLVSVAVVPVSLADLHAPVLPEPDPMPVRDLWHTAPLAAVGAVVTGFIGSAVLGGGVVYAAEVGLDRLVTGLFIGAALVGGAALQVPLGSWSDRVDRRLVILVASTAAVVTSGAMAVLDPSHRLVLIGLMTLTGGISYSLYSMANAHLYDYLDDRLVVAGGARMVLVNGVGAIAGPIVGAAAVGLVGPGALFVVVGVAYAVIGVTALARIAIRRPAPSDERAAFAPVPVAVAPTSAAIEAELDDVFAPSEGDVRVAGVSVHYRDQGDGPPMVLLGPLEDHG
ncbi:MAG: MFS transporter, partial [Acidimicrobiales bacterium]|nr:MFS transporter [Acidimicrobiales bacterium]